MIFDLFDSRNGNAQVFENIKGLWYLVFDRLIFIIDCNFMAQRRWCWRVLIRGKGRRLFQAKDTVWICVGRQDMALYTQHMANNLARLGYVVWVILWWNIKLEIYSEPCFGRPWMSVYGAEFYSLGKGIFKGGSDLTLALGR